MSLHVFQHAAGWFMDEGNPEHQHTSSSDDNEMDAEDCIYCILSSPAVTDEQGNNDLYIPNESLVNTFRKNIEGEPVSIGYSLRAPPFAYV